MADPWAFGWTQVFTLIGFTITVIIAIAGFRTFGRWRREQIEQEKIAVAVEALSLAYEAKSVFARIRAENFSRTERNDALAQSEENLSDDPQASLKPHYRMVLDRLERNQEYFDRVYRLQPKFMAVFGPQTEAIFADLLGVRDQIEDAADLLIFDEQNLVESSDWWRQHRYDVLPDYGMGRRRPLRSAPPDRLGARIEQFRVEIEAICRPLLDARSKTIITRWWN